MPERIRLENIAIILHKPKIPENIGSAARAMRNMGIGELIVVEPENYIPERIQMLATHESASIVDQIQLYDKLNTALASFQYVVGTTGRLGGERKTTVRPPRLAENLIPISQENRVAIIFGPEDRGLSNEELRLCQAVVTIPTADFHSINLAQSVMIICYELFKASRNEDSQFFPRLANHHELEGMYEQLKEILVRISYINAENPDYWMNALRRFCARFQLTAREVRMIRGICRQINWYGNKRYQDGLKENQSPCD